MTQRNRILDETRGGNRLQARKREGQKGIDTTSLLHFGQNRMGKKIPSVLGEMADHLSRGIEIPSIETAKTGRKSKKTISTCKQKLKKRGRA